MVNINGVTIQYGDRILLNNIQLTLKKGERIGLIGRNGAGKSTLLKVIGGFVIPDSGNIDFPSDYNIGYLKQEIDFSSDISILEETMSCFEELNRVEAEISFINEQLAIRTDYESEAYANMIDNLSTLTEQLGILGEGNVEGETVKILKGLGFNDHQIHDSIKTLSGGWKMRIELAKLLLTSPNLLLLDEPTNHLDIESIIWLEGYLNNYQGTIIIISHDTRFLQNTVNRVIEIELGRAIDIKGTYHHFIKEKDKQREILEAAFQNQQKTIEQQERTITRFMAKASKTSMAQSMQKQLDKIERIEIPQEDNREMRLRFGEVPRSSRVMYQAKSLSKAYGQKEVIRGVDFIVERGDKVAFVGQNGQGKSTLAKVIIGEIPATGGSLEIGENIFISYYAQNETDLIKGNKTVLEIAEENAPPEWRTRVRKVLGQFLFSGEDVEKKVSVLSGGEKARLALACKIMHPTNLIVLDEPTNHLDIKAKKILKEALNAYEGSLIVVSHDRDFLSGLTAKVFEFRDHKIKEYLGDVEYYLDKKQVDDIRKIEITSAKNKELHQNAEKHLVEIVDKKALEKKIKYLERDINEIESTLKQLEDKMAQVNDYNSDEYITLTTTFSEKQKLLAVKESAWEELVDQLG